MRCLIARKFCGINFRQRSQSVPHAIATMPATTACGKQVRCVIVFRLHVNSSVIIVINIISSSPCKRGLGLFGVSVGIVFPRLLRSLYFLIFFLSDLLLTAALLTVFDSSLHPNHSSSARQCLSLALYPPLPPPQTSSQHLNPAHVTLSPAKNAHPEVVLFAHPPPHLLQRRLLGCESEVVAMHNDTHVSLRMVESR